MPAMQHNKTVFGCSAKCRWTRGHAKAPTIPDPIDVMDRSAMAMVPMCSSVRAKSTAVPEIVATASERRNHDSRKRTVWRRRIALRNVLQNERRENDV